MIIDKSENTYRTIDPDALTEGMIVTFTTTMEFYSRSMGKGYYFKLPKADHFGADIQEVYFHKPEMISIVSVAPTPLQAGDEVWHGGQTCPVVACTSTHAWIERASGGAIVPLSEIERVSNIPIQVLL